MSKPAPERGRLGRWLAAQRGGWQQLEQAERQLGSARLSLTEADTLASGYRSLAGDVTAVRALLPDSPLARQIEALYRRLHERLHRPYEPVRERLSRLYFVEVPAATRRLLPALLATFLLFTLSALAGAALVHNYPELGSLFLSEGAIDGVLQGRLWTEQIFAVAPPSMVSAGIAANNIVVTLTAYVLGVFYGLGTLYIIGLNGLMFGAILAFLAPYGLSDELSRFVLAHGVAEISVILIAGAAGLRVGESLARPGEHTRADAFRLAVADTSRLLFVCVPALLGCGWIEGHVSPSSDFSWWQRGVIGVGYATLLWAAMFGKLRWPARRKSVT